MPNPPEHFKFAAPKASASFCICRILFKQCCYIAYIVHIRAYICPYIAHIGNVCLCPLSSNNQINLFPPHEQEDSDSGYGLLL